MEGRPFGSTPCHAWLGLRPAGMQGPAGCDPRRCRSSGPTWPLGILSPRQASLSWVFLAPAGSVVSGILSPRQARLAQPSCSPTGNSMFALGLL